MKGTTAQNASGNSLSAQSRRKKTTHSGCVFRALRKLALLFDASIIFAAMAVAAGIEWQAPRFWQVWVLSNIPQWKILSAFGGFAVVLLWASSHHYNSNLAPRTLFLEQKLNLQDCAISAVFLVAVLYLIGADSLSRGLILLFLVLVAFGLGLRRLIFQIFPAEPEGSRNVLIIGADSTALAIREQLREDLKLGYVFKGFVKFSDSEPDSMDDPREVIGTVDKLAEHVFNYSVNEVFLTPSCSREMAMKLVNQARELGISSRMVFGHLRFAVKQTNRLRS